MNNNIKTGTCSIIWATSLLPSDPGADARTGVTLLIIRSEIQVRNIEIVIFFARIFTAILLASVSKITNGHGADVRT